MIARTWRGQAATTAAADAYANHFRKAVLPALQDLAGHRGAWLLRRESEGGAEFVALTLWDSRQAIEAFTGPDIGRAVVEPAARAVLRDFDDRARHYEVVVGPVGPSAAAHD